MPEIKRLLTVARQDLTVLQAQVEVLSRIVGDSPSGASQRASEGSAATEQRVRATKRKVQRRKAASKRKGAPKAAPSQERAVRALEKAGRPMGPADLFRYMKAEGLDAPTDIPALNARLWAAAKAGRVVNIDGKYSPVGGFPVPGQLPGPGSNGSSTAVLQTSPQSLTQGGGGGPRELEKEMVAPS